MTREALVQRAVAVLQDQLSGKVSVALSGEKITCCAKGRCVSFIMLLPAPAARTVPGQLYIPVDFVFTAPQKIVALISGKLGLNKVEFARKCTVVQLEKKTANAFIDEFHLMGSASSAWNLGLERNGLLFCAASFSKGRRMRRLRDDERSYELIRFCCRAGVTVSGGLSRLLTAFCRQKNAAEIMTYVDRQFSDGRAFAAGGFRATAFTPPIKFSIDPVTFARTPAQDDDPGRLPIWNAGNIKMLYSCR